MAKKLIDLVGITKSYGDKVILDDMNLFMNENRFLTLLGPSGCRKTTTLRIIGGFETPDKGKVIFDGKDITSMPPNERNLNTVFQKYALFTHMNIEENIAFGLKIKNKSKSYIKDKIKYALKLVNLDGFEKRMPDSLSGGQQQRIAIARAIVNEPKVLLLDEPLGALDLKMRQDMQYELIRLKNELGITFIYVTHDQVEAMTMADRIVIMKEGVIQQVGKPMELYDHPVNKFVAGFIGSPQMNFFDVTLKGNEVTFEDGNKLMLPEAILKKLNGKEGEMTLGIRGEDLKMDGHNLELYKENKMKAVITDTEVMGNENNLYFQFGGCQAVARVSKYEISQVGDEIEFVFMPSKIHFFDKETEMNYL